MSVIERLLVFDLLRDQLHTIFWMIPMFIQAKVSLDRVDDFLHNVSAYYFSSNDVYLTFCISRQSCWMSFQTLRRALSASC